MVEREVQWWEPPTHQDPLDPRADEGGASRLGPDRVPHVRSVCGRVILGFLFGFLLGGAGCARNDVRPLPQDTGEARGYAFDTSQLFTSTRDSITWSLASARERRYEEILVDPLTFRFGDRSIERAGATDDGARLLREGFQAALEAIVAPEIPIVDTPSGASALRISPSLVDRIRFPQLLEHRGTLTQDPQGSLPRVCLEVAVYDAATEELVAAGISQRDAHLFELGLRGDLDAAGARRVFAPVARRLALQASRARAEGR